MSKLSKEKLNYFKTKENLTNLKISELTNIPISNIDKIFSGANKNPTLETIQKIASVLNCTIDDFIDYKKPPEAPVYIDKKTMEILSLLKCLKKPDFDLISTLCKRLNK